MMFRNNTSERKKNIMIKKIPNILTICRILLIPVIVVAFYLDGKFSNLLAAIIFIFASITDYLDGMLARMWHAQTQFGRILDPIADKLLVVATLVMMIHTDKAPVIPALLILLREILVSGLREHLSAINISVPVTNLSKIKTAIQMIAIITLILGNVFWFPHVTLFIGQVLIWVAAILTLITGYAYCREGFKNI